MRFQEEFAPEIEVQQLARKFQDFRQTTEAMAEITQYTINEGMKKEKYHDMLRDDIRQFLSLSGCKTYNNMIARARERDSDLELLGSKCQFRHHHQRVSLRGPRPRANQGLGHCAKCGKNHEGRYLKKEEVYYDVARHGILVGISFVKHIYVSTAIRCTLRRRNVRG